MISTGSPSSRQTPLQTAARLAALLVALVGLFAMHGLADHGSAGHGSMPGMTAEVLPGLAAADGHGDSHATPATSGATADVWASQPAGDHSDSGLVELCLAIVAALMLFAAGALFSWGRLTIATLLAAQRQTAAWVRARDPVPVDLTLLCIQRC